ncbi:hypothetical protein SBRY_110135 [Actinacidiphila bryophytorum]|uniref:Uncharacterized protein n=1 Tax=Actinacidiphila bryophytorum TaxID=1436133 RepID=A0A9W4GYF7_9ACTN|nr:hypothetical protein SBRY_110135 [Actinacidiphila bryophytorum]
MWARRRLGNLRPLEDRQNLPKEMPPPWSAASDAAPSPPSSLSRSPLSPPARQGTAPRP